MNCKTDKESRSCDDIAFLSEIITNYRYWQDARNRFAVSVGISLASPGRGS